MSATRVHACHRIHSQHSNAVRAILGEAIPTTMHSIDTELHKTQNLVWKYTGMVTVSPHYCTNTLKACLTAAIIERASQDEYRDEVLILELIKQAAINCRQHEVFLQILWVQRHLQIVVFRLV